MKTKKRIVTGVRSFQKKKAYISKRAFVLRSAKGRQNVKDSFRIFPEGKTQNVLTKLPIKSKDSIA